MAGCHLEGFLEEMAGCHLEGFLEEMAGCHLEGFLEETAGSHQLCTTAITGSSNIPQGLGGNLRGVLFLQCTPCRVLLPPEAARAGQRVRSPT